MKSSSGSHYIALDHVRALAAFIVFAWHFLHSTDPDYPLPLAYTPDLFPFAILDEGHTGVALFMTLSGYLFAKLLEGRRIHYGLFLWNRAVRLLPLLLLVMVVVGVIKYRAGESLQAYAESILHGFYLPTWPNGGWSIVIEFHFYLLLPLLLWLLRRSRLLPFTVVLAAIVLRTVVLWRTGEAHSIAYWTIFGRIDQFVLGMLAFHFRALMTHRHWLALAVFAAFSAFYWYFDRLGGFFRNPTYPSTSPLWIVIPTLEGLAYGLAIAWYETSFRLPTTGFSRVLARVGDYSYAMYLLHFFFVFEAARFVNENIMSLSNFYLACAWAAVGFICMLPVCYLSFQFVESPFLRLRKPYLLGGTAAA